MTGEEKDIVPCMVVPVDRVEEVRKKLCEDNLLDHEHRIEHGHGVAYLPLLDVLDAGFAVEKHACRRVVRRPSSYKELLDMPLEDVEMLPSAYDVIGDLVVIRLPDDLLENCDAVGRALLDFVPGARAVFVDKGTQGEWRIRDLRHIAGEDRTKTVHRENGVNMVVDIARAYFSPRLAGEHWRVTSLVEPGERVLDMFTGTGGFPLTIAKHRPPQRIKAVDINPAAIGLLEESMALNRLTGIETVVGDALETSPDMQADRVIMNLPHGARRFLTHALECARPGGIVHYHEILEPKHLGNVEQRLKAEHGVNILSAREVRTYSPGQSHMVFDLEKL